MSEQSPSVAATVAAIEACFGHRWGVWLSDTGWWWAARTQSLTAAQLGAGCVPYLHGDNPDELTELIRQQERVCSASAQSRDEPAGHDPPHPPRPIHE